MNTRLLFATLVSSFVIACGGGGDDGGARPPQPLPPVTPFENPDGSGNIDGSITAARFNRPTAVVIDADGNRFIADSANHTIRRMAAVDGTVTTLAGRPGTPGTDDGAGSAARFNRPLGLVLDGEGGLYVADTGNHTVRHVSATGVVTTVAGAGGQAGAVDGAPATARFNAPVSLAFDGTRLFVADWANHTIRMIARNGTVSTLAGRAGSADHAVPKTTGGLARFRFPSGVAHDVRDGSVYVIDGDNCVIRRIDIATDEVRTVAGLSGDCRSVDDPDAASRMDTRTPLPGTPHALGLLVLPTVPGATESQLAFGDSSVAASHLRAVFNLRLDGGSGIQSLSIAPKTGFKDGALTDAEFHDISSIALFQASPTGAIQIVIADAGNHALRRLDLNGVVTDAGKRPKP
jgi:hypothetical protein